MPPLPSVAPNGNYWLYEYAGLDGVYKTLYVTAAARPIAPQRETADNMIRGIVQGAPVGNQPLPVGSLTLSDIQPTPTSYTPYQEIVGGYNSFTGTNSTIAKQVDTTIRLVSLRATCDMAPIGGRTFYIVYTGVEMRFAPSPAEADTGSTWEVALKVYGTVGAEVYI